jgi:hypothetical protein
MAVRKTVEQILDELNRMHDEDVARNQVPVTSCKTITNTRLEHTRHGVIRHVTTVLIKY